MENLPPFIIRLFQPTDFNAALAVFQAAALADALPQRATADALRARVSVASTDSRLNPADDLWKWRVGLTINETLRQISTKDDQ